MINMDNNNLIPRCKACSKLYKKTEENELGLCPLCLRKQEDEGHANENSDVSEQKLDIELSDRKELRDKDDHESSRTTEKEIRPGNAIRQRFLELISQQLITAEVLNMLLDKEDTGKTLGIRYPFLKAYNPDVSIKEITYINGNARYSSRPIEISGEQYLITNDLYAKNVPRFMEWADSISKQK